jgi:hypothetical protein
MPYNGGMPLALVVLMLLLPMLARAETSTRRWRNGATTLCETMPPPAVNGQPQGSQPTKITTCWRHGAKVRCQAW